MPRRPFTVKMYREPEKMTTLATDALEKHTTDGAASPIPAATATQLQAKKAEADAQATLQGLADKTKEERNEQRNLKIGIAPTQSSITPGTILFHVTSISKFLLGQFRGSERKLGDWSFTVNSPKGVVQVKIPRGAGGLIKLAKGILKKHTDDGEDSILAGFDMDGLQTLVEDAAILAEQAAKAGRDREKATEARNLALGIAKGQNTKTPGTVAFFLRSIRDILLGIYRGQEQQLGDWGFEVNFHTPPPPTPPGE